MDVVVPAASRCWLGPALVAGLATLLVCSSLDPAGQYPRGLSGPGITLDESFNVDLGCLMIDRLLAGDLSGYAQATGMLPDHPPLGRLWLGLWHEIAYVVVPPRLPGTPVSIASARAGSAIAFGLLVFLIGHTASRWYRPLIGTWTAFFVVCLPRLFGHAHIAALELSLTTLYAAAVLIWTRWLPAPACPPTLRDIHSPRDALPICDALPPPTTRQAILAGVIFGLALLTKIQAALLPVPLALWLIATWGLRAGIRLTLIWGLTGTAIFFVGWPWLWAHPLDHMLAYFARTTDRAVLYAWYCDQAWPDRDLPWHYPWVFFITTVPLGLHLLAISGLFPGRQHTVTETTSPPHQLLPVTRSPHDQLLLATLVFPLVVFSVPGIAVYDAERLFLMSFPLWMLLAARGLVRAQLALDRPRAADTLLPQQTLPVPQPAASRHRFGLPSRAVALLAVIFLAGQSLGLYRHFPCHLSYYNLATGGLTGAAKRGLPLTYWGDTLTRDFWSQVCQHLPAGSVVQFVPVMHGQQLRTLHAQIPQLAAAGIQLVPYDGQHPSRYVIFFIRKEYLPDEFRQHIPPAGILVQITHEGLPLAVLFDRDRLSSATDPAGPSTAAPPPR